MTDDKKRVLGIIVAAGSGERLGAALPKALVEVAGKTILERTIEKLKRAKTPFEALLITYPEGYRSQFEHLLQAQEWECQLIEGGETRQASVRRALLALTEMFHPNPTDRIVIHDAARCNISPDLVDSVVEAVCETGAATLGIPLTDTIQRVDRDSKRIEGSISREGLWRMQTPQAFEYRHIMRAHDDGFEAATDDSTLVSSFCPVVVVKGDECNLKITAPIDLKFLEILENSSSKFESF